MHGPVQRLHTVMACTEKRNINVGSLNMKCYKTVFLTLKMPSVFVFFY